MRLRLSVQIVLFLPDLGLISGDGVFGLQRGFRLAGGLWKVETDATPLLMQTFYKSLASGHSPVVSLCEAQEVLRKKEEYNNPYYWASFILLEQVSRF